jgi:hypothetical protein
LTIGVKYEVNYIPAYVIIRKIFHAYTCGADDVIMQINATYFFQELPILP